MTYPDKNDEEIPRGGGDVSGKAATESPTDTIFAQPTNSTPNESDTEAQYRTLSDKS